MPTVALSDDQVPPADSPVTKPQPVVALSDDQVPVAPSTDSTEQITEINKQFDLRELAYDDAWSNELIRMLCESGFPMQR